MDSQSPLEAWGRAMAEHAARLIVGARVRVRLNRECDVRIRPERIGHPPDYDGQTAVIDAVEHWPHPTHPFLVVFDSPSMRYAEYFTAAELVPLDIINVRDFGATGDGSDQTEAINAALTEAARRRPTISEREHLLTDAARRYLRGEIDYAELTAIRVTTDRPARP